MNRIMIFGRPGSGKSTFTYQLAVKTGLPLHYLDKHFFVSGWIERDNQEFMQIQKNITKDSTWIIDGNSTNSLETRWKNAELVLYLNYNKIVCLLRRLFIKSVHIDDRADNFPEVLSFKLIKYMWAFETRVMQAIARLKVKYPAVKFIEINSEKDLEIIEAMICKSPT